MFCSKLRFAKHHSIIANGWKFIRSKGRKTMSTFNCLYKRDEMDPSGEHPSVISVCRQKTFCYVPRATSVRGKVDYNGDACGAKGIRRGQFRKHTIARYRGPATSLSVIPVGHRKPRHEFAPTNFLANGHAINLIVGETWRVMGNMVNTNDWNIRVCTTE